MLEELQRRHYSEATARYYIRAVERFARHFHCSPDRLGPGHIREYQAQLFAKQKLSPGAVTNHLCALRFLYIQTLKKPWSVADTPYPKKTHRLPAILSQGEVAQLIDAACTPFHRTILMTLYATGVRNAELTHLKISDLDSRRMVIHVQGGKGRQDRDVMLSPILLDELRAHWRRLRRKSSIWLFPGNRWHSGDQPIDKARQRELLPSPYLHVVFTLPPQLASLALQNKKVVYGLLLRASAETLLEVARNPRHLGAEIGFFSVLHTWNQKLQLHPHVHCVVAAGGLSLDHTRWIRSRPRFFLPIPVLRRVFRGKFVAGLKRAFQHQQLNFSGDLSLLDQPKIFAAWLRPLFRKDWIVYCKPPFGGPEYVLQYLGRYTHRVAISNHRLISLANGQVTFGWRDSAHNHEQKLMTVSLDEFLRRFLLHLLPKGFVRIRHFGFLANRRRSTLLPLCCAALGAVPPQTEPETSTPRESSPLWLCPNCGAPMIVVERLTAAQIQLRSPPLRVTVAA